MSNADGVTIVIRMYSAIIFIKSLPLYQTAWADMMTVQVNQCPSTIREQCVLALVTAFYT